MEDQHGPIPRFGTGQEAIPADDIMTPHTAWEEEHHADLDDEIEVTVSIAGGVLADLAVWFASLEEGSPFPITSDKVILEQTVAELITEAVENLAENGREVDLPNHRRVFEGLMVRLAQLQYDALPEGGSRD